MNAGYYKHRIYIFREYKSVDEYGETIKGEFKEINSTRAEVVKLLGNLSVENDNTVYNNLYKFKVRMYADIRDYDRIKYDDKFYRILDIFVKDDHQVKEITAEVIVDE